MDLSYNELEGKIPSFVLGKGQTSEVIREFYLQVKELLLFQTQKSDLG